MYVPIIVFTRIRSISIVLFTLVLGQHKCSTRNYYTPSAHGTENLVIIYVLSIPFGVIITVKCWNIQ